MYKHYAIQHYASFEEDMSPVRHSFGDGGMSILASFWSSDLLFLE